MQLLNVAFGGDIIQHIDGHSQSEDKSVPTHGVFLDKDSYLYSITGECELRVNSFHHQAVGNIGAGLYPVAWAGWAGEAGEAEASENRIVEAIESKNGFVLGLQWHPEALSDDISSKVFKSFISACAVQKEE